MDPTTCRRLHHEEVKKRHYTGAETRNRSQRSGRAARFVIWSPVRGINMKKKRKEKKRNGRSLCSNEVFGLSIINTCIHLLANGSISDINEIKSTSG